MISECLHDIYDKTDIESFYNQHSPNNMPPLLICQDKLVQQNKDVESYNLLSNDSARNNNNKNNNNNNKNNNNNNNYLNNLDDDCILPINIRSHTNASELQQGFGKNIDIDSELKRINHYDDKCFYDNYKVNPSTFKCHQDVFNRQTEGLNYMKGMVNYNLNVEHDIKTNCIQSPGMFPRCPQSEFAPLAINHHKGINNNNNQTVKYRFTNEGYCREFACQKLFNNFTKRSSNSVDERANN
jgi:hypothetical protein